MVAAAKQQRIRSLRTSFTSEKAVGTVSIPATSGAPVASNHRRFDSREGDRYNRNSLSSTEEVSDA
jgi:hypothetical protein